MVMQDENSPTDIRTAEDRSQEPGPAPVPASYWGLLAAGAGLMLVAAALVVAPSLSSGSGWIARSLARHGIAGGTVALGGLMLLGLYDIARSHRRLSSASDADVQPARARVEGLAGALAEANGGIQEIRVEIVHLKDAVRAVRERSAETGGDGQQDAMFRLAASLDQLGARIEQRLKAQHLD